MLKKSYDLVYRLHNKEKKLYIIMRIIAGTYRGRTLECPNNVATRPTTDRVRESLFGILDSMQARGDIPLWRDLMVLDGFCGAGTLGFEALSRGAAHVLFIDNDAETVRVCTKNAQTFHITQEQIQMTKQNLLTIGKKPNHLLPRNLVFLDPPYGQNLGKPALMHLQEKEWLAPECLCVLETDKKHPEPLAEEYARLKDERLYGRTRIQIFHLKI